jgi:two-component system sensor histidine kinase KdpD
MSSIGSATRSGAPAHGRLVMREEPSVHKASDNTVERVDPRWGWSFQWCMFGSLAVAVVTWFGYRLHFSFAAASLCYLLLIVGQSLAGDFAASSLVSLMALGCLDYFFTSPVLSFRVTHPLNILALVCFLLTALVITRLVANARARAESSYDQHRKTQRLYEVAQHLLAVDPGETSGVQFLEPFCGAFGVKAACLFDAESAEVHAAGESAHDLQARTRAAYQGGRDDDDRERGIFVRCIRVAGRVTGAVGFEGLEDASLTAGPLTTLAASLLERSHAFRNANLATAAAQTEAYRSVILDALAHEFKTPLSTILAAAGALRETASLGPEHLEMAETVESEAALLGRLTTRLIRTARLEQEEIRPWMELTHFASVVAEAVKQYSKRSGDRKITVLDRCHSSDVLADPELLRLAISQLLDNACKYSQSGSTVSLTISKREKHIALRVLSTGTPIPSSERTHIFDRFYRGLDARRMTPGTGLGLYVARKIAIAHGGVLELDSEPLASDSAVFQMLLPIPESEHDDLR